MQTLNQLTLIGYVAAPPFYTTTEKAAADLTRFVLLTERPDTLTTPANETCDRHQCVAWGPVSLLLHQYLCVGSRVAIGGRLQYHQFKDSSGQERSLTEVVVERFTFLDQGK